MPEAHSIRPARVDETRLLSDLALRSKAHWGYSPEFNERCREELSYSEEQLLPEHMCFFVEPTFIGSGFGRSLMEHATSTASTLGAKQLIVQSDPYAKRFYVAAGGVVTGTRESASIPGRYLPTLAIDLASHM